MAPHPYGDRHVTVVVDVTPIHDRSSLSRLLGMGVVPGCSKQVFHT